MRIDCDECRMQATDACADCVVTFIVGREPGDAVVIDVVEARAVRLLARAGLVPELRHEPASHISVPDRDMVHGAEAYGDRRGRP
jgi:hypothetical protein